MIMGNLRNPSRLATNNWSAFSSAALRGAATLPRKAPTPLSGGKK